MIPRLCLSRGAIAASRSANMGQLRGSSVWTQFSVLTHKNALLACKYGAAAFCILWLCHHLFWWHARAHMYTLTIGTLVGAHRSWKGSLAQIITPAAITLLLLLFQFISNTILSQQGTCVLTCGRCYLCTDMTTAA